MTIIKYASIMSIREEDGHYLLGRGKQDATVRAMAQREDSDRHELVTMERETVIDLPEPMSPSEYAEWVEANGDDILDEWWEDQTLECDEGLDD